MTSLTDLLKANWRRRLNIEVTRVENEEGEVAKFQLHSWVQLCSKSSQWDVKFNRAPWWIFIQSLIDWLEDDRMQVLRHSILSRFLREDRTESYAESCLKNSTWSWRCTCSNKTIGFVTNNTRKDSLKSDLRSFTSKNFSKYHKNHELNRRQFVSLSNAILRLFLGFTKFLWSHNSCISKRHLAVELKKGWDWLLWQNDGGGDEIGDGSLKVMRKWTQRDLTIDLKV